MKNNTNTTNVLTAIDKNETRNINAGATTYRCPFGCSKTGGYWSVYWHCLSTRCFTKNKALNGIWKAAGFCFSTAFEAELCRSLNALGKVGKHAMR